MVREKDEGPRGLGGGAAAGGDQEQLYVPTAAGAAQCGWLCSHRRGCVVIGGRGWRAGGVDRRQSAAGGDVRS